jgi:hypothetical protein
MTVSAMALSTFRVRLISLCITLLLHSPGFAQEAATETAPESETAPAPQAAKPEKSATSSAADTSAAVAALQTLLEKQQALLDQQAAQIEQQNKTLAELQKQLNDVKKKQEAAVAPMQEQSERIASQSAALQGLQTEIDSVKQAQQETPSKPSANEIALKERLAKLETSVAEIPQDPAAMMGMESFPGALRIPGTNAAIKFGGYVNVDYARSFAPLVSKDRFIVGSIPVPNTNDAVQQSTSLTANQSRFNVDVRENTSVGAFRAFMEGDFGGTDNTFRLRHAFGQFKDVLAGQTWSAFYDPQAAPEEIDFEGISGRVVLRQTQVRWFPSIGKEWDLQFSLEDPQPEITEYCDQNNPLDNGCLNTARVFAQGASNNPDAIVSVRRNFGDRYHLRFAGLSRQLRATTSIQGSTASITDSTNGWGLTVSGVIKAGWWSANDNIKFQIIGGKGIGRYTNDPNTIGGLDGVFDQNANIKALPLFAGFLAYEHWWTSTQRSTFLGSWVNINTFDFQPDDAYRKTRRLTANYLWSPIPRVDVGAEFLWGKRINKDKQSGTATQLQLMSRYRF